MKRVSLPFTFLNVTKRWLTFKDTLTHYDNHDEDGYHTGGVGCHKDITMVWENYIWSRIALMSWQTHDSILFDIKKTNTPTLAVLLHRRLCTQALIPIPDNSKPTFEKRRLLVARYNECDSQPTRSTTGCISGLCLDESLDSEGWLVFNVMFNN